MSIERTEFSKRLQKALASAKFSPDSPTQLSREFNERYTGRKVTVHAARKWLVGEAIPTQDKLRALAEWLSCDPAWLRYGDGSDLNQSSSDGRSEQERDERRLLGDIRLLDAHHRDVLSEMVRVMVKVSRQNGR